MTDHERCSELLAGYRDDALSAEEAAWVSAHLEACPDCRAELAGLEALDGGDADLTEIERARLHREVLHELGLMTGPARQPTPWGARAAQLLGAAATVALLVVGLVYVGNNLGGTGSGDDSAVEGGGDGDAGVGDPFSREEAAQDGVTSETSGGGVAALGKRAEAPPEPTVSGDLGPVSDRALRATGRKERPFTGFPGNVRTAEVEDYRATFLDELVAQAPEEVSEQLRRCATDVLAQIPTAVATYAAPARYGDPPRRVLVVGFAYSFSEDGFLDQYQMWIYPRGSCDFPLNYIGGTIGR
jgi:anti-sigma factor RsiW